MKYKGSIAISFSVDDTDFFKDLTDIGYTLEVNGLNRWEGELITILDSRNHSEKRNYYQAMLDRTKGK